MAKKRPLVSANLVNEFGSAEFDHPSHSDTVMDRTYVPGFSDMRFERDRKLGELARGECDPEDVPVLPANLRWVRRAKVSGEPDASKQLTSQMAGYRAVTQDDFVKQKDGELKGKHTWLTAVPQGASWAADGTLRLGDTTLMVTDQRTAARNAARKQQRTQRLVESAPLSGFEAEGVRGDRFKGADPSARKITDLSKGEVFG